MPQRFLWWMAGVARGDFGTTVTGRPVTDELRIRAVTSAWLYLPATVLAVVAGCVLGVRSARRRSDAMGLLTTVIVLALPAFVLGTLLKIFWLPVNELAGTQLLYFSGERSPGAPDGWAGAVDRLQHLILPTLCIAIPQAVYYARYQRATALDVIDSSYVRAARLRGLPARTAFRRHGLRTALVPMTSMFAFGFGIHLASGVFAERVFGWHGLGSWLLESISGHDAMVCASIVLILAVLVVGAGWLADITAYALDPRMRDGRQAVGP
ncbi:ABC transporter permease [Mycolicibacterium neoaurum]|uniref:ABC transporter permease n=1 Tax=Mycolicibacterium neoaurum TaxID=1795 RepID=UPI00267372FE|nr:ABC transporter permease [Mycolicibacterium neoaurum]MDO3399912.1 ABC transporter permease [Mycolicibacterium neoaurum]